MREMLTRVQKRLVWWHKDERGLSTAELLGNAALAIAALVVIWGVLQTLGVDVVNWIRGEILGG